MQILLQYIQFANYQEHRPSRHVNVLSDVAILAPREARSASPWSMQLQRLSAKTNTS